MPQHHTAQSVAGIIANLKKNENNPLLLTKIIHNNTMQIAIYNNTAVLVSNINDYENTATVTFDNGKEKTVPVDQIQFR